MKKYSKQLIIFIGILLFIAIIYTISLFLNKVSMNEIGTIGNTAANLNNGGLFCESDGMVYFSNAADDGCLYSMTVEEENLQKLTTVSVRNILAGGDYLYYFQVKPSGEAGLGYVRSSRSFNRSKKNGKEVTALTTDVVVTAQLVDNYLYLLTAASPTPEFYKIKIDKSDIVSLANYQVNPACAENSTIYYNGTQSNHYLFSMDTKTDYISEVFKGNLWYPHIDGDYIYYLDIENDYCLSRYVRNENRIEIMTTERIDCFNVGNGYIYYQVNSEANPQLKMMRTDGTGMAVIAEGNYTNINMTSRYVYFQEFGKDSIMYHAQIGSPYSSIWSNP